MLEAFLEDLDLVTSFGPLHRRSFFNNAEVKLVLLERSSVEVLVLYTGGAKDTVGLRRGGVGARRVCSWRWRRSVVVSSRYVGDFAVLQDD